MKKLYPKKIFVNNISIKLMLFAFLLISGIYNSYGQIVVPFAPRTSEYTPTKTNYTIKGDFTMIGNTNLQLAGETYPTNQHNGNDMEYVDIDNDPNTWNSSSAFLNFSNENGALPDCSNIVYAGIYWTGRAAGQNQTDTDTFQITKNVPTGNTTTQQITNTDIDVRDNNSIANTNYSLDITTGGTGGSSYTQFAFTSSGAGDSVRFRFFSNTNIQVSRNNGAFTSVAGSFSNNYFNFSAPYLVFSNSSYTLEVTRLRTNNTDRAFVNVTYSQTVPETIAVTKNFDKRKISIKGPLATTYTELDADGIAFPNTNTYGKMFSAYTEVTDYVRQNGIGNYFVADIALREGRADDTGYYGGWGMVVVYENSKMKWRDITVFDGHAYVTSGIAEHIINISGFNATQNGAVNLKLGLMAGEGDINYTGDYFQMLRQDTGLYESLSHSNNSATNFFNSSILTGGNTKNPNYNNNTGLDIVMFDIDNGNNNLSPLDNNKFITNNQTSTSFRYGSLIDTYIIFNATFSVDAYIPEPEGILTTSTPIPSSVLPGGAIDYLIEIKNRGTEATNNTVITIPVPYTSSYENLSITYAVNAPLTTSSIPYFNPNLGATGSIVWEIGTLPVTSSPDDILATLGFTLTATTDCSILTNPLCTPTISLGGSISGVGNTSSVPFVTQLIQGYASGNCEGEPIPLPSVTNIDTTNYDCSSYTAVRDFYFCNIGSTPIQTSQISAQFPPASRFYNEYPRTSTTIEYTTSNPFPSTLGTNVYYAVPPGSTTCYFQFTINVTNVTSVPTVQDVTYCLNETASALTATPSDAPTSPSAFTLYYYVDNNPSTPAQTSIVPSTDTAGETIYYVAEGYSNSCISTVRVPIKVTVYGEDPEITAPNSIEIEGCDENAITASTARYPYSAAQSTDIKASYVTTGYTASDDDTITSITYIDLINPSASCPLVVTRTFTITDSCGNTTNAVQNITVTQGNFTLPADGSSTVECLADAQTAPTPPTVLDACGNTIVPVIKTTPSDIQCEGSMVWVYTYTDCAGNAYDWSYTYTINVTTAPIVPANGSSTVECIADATQPTAPVITDACGNNLVPVITQSADPTCEGDKVYTFTYTDCAGNVAVYTYTYTIDLLAFTLPANGTQTVGNLADATTPTPPTVTDNCGNILTPSTPTVSSTPDCQGSVVYTFTYTDCAGNTADWTYTYTIELDPFTVPANGSATVECIADATQPTAPVVTDANGNVLTPVMTQSADPTCEGDKVYTFTYTDCAGNTADWVYTYTINVTTAPVVPANGSSTVECIADAIQPTAPVITDACGNSLVPVITESADPACEGDKVYTFTYTDCAGNISVYTYTYTINVTTAPVVPANGSSTVECIADAIQPTAPIVTDACGNNLVPVITQSADPTCEGDKVYTFTYTDCAGNVAVYTYTYTINVTTAPIVPANGSSTVECIADATQPTAPVITDACGNNLVPVITQSADPTCEGDKVYTFTYTDCAGNVAVYTYTYTIDLLAFTLPANGIQTVGNLADATTPTPPTVTDNCGNMLTPSTPTVSSTPDCQGSVVYTFTYTDCAGNTADWTYTYTIELDPFTVPANGSATVECIADATQPTAPVVTDANGNVLTPVMTQSADPTCEGDKVYTFTYTDCAGNTADWVYTYTINITTAPIVPANGSANVECIADATQPSAPIVTDACGNNLVPVITESADPTCEGDKVYTFTYTDCAGNVSVYTYTYTINVTTAPVVPANGSSTVECIADATQPTAPVITDACGNNLVPVITQSADPTCEGDKVYTFTYTDCAGNVAVYTYTYTINVTTAPVVPANGSSTVECIADATQPTAPIVTDACGNNLVPVITQSADPTCEGDKVYTFTYTDCAGNVAVYTYTYTIDLLAFTLPANGIQTVGNLADATTPTPPTVTDNCGNMLTPSTPTVSSTPDCQGSVVYTFTYTDCAGNTADWTYTYTIELDPFTVPANGSATVECIADATQPTAPVVTDANGNVLTPVMTQSADPTCEGDKVYTFTYTDCAGNTADWVYTYTINITTAPIVPANGSANVECIADATQPSAPIVTDACGNNLVPVITESADPTCEGDKVYTFTYTDCAGNVSVYTYTYTINVTTAPVVPANGSSTVECIADATQPTAPIVTDACGNNLVPVITQSADPTCEGDKVYTFTYTDCAGNVAVYTYTYTINVTTAPVVPANGSSTVECIADATQPTAPVITDACGNNLVPVITQSADPTCEGDKVYTFTYTDCAGNVAVYTYTYTVKDTTAPVLILPLNTTAECSADLSTIAFGNATATDNCDPNPVVTYEDVIIAGACPGSYTITRTWKATDACGNFSTANQIISTSDTTAPEFVEINLPENISVECDAIPVAETLTATDNCGTATVTVNDVRTNGNCANNYIITRTWTATDECGLTATYTQIITVQDVTPPTFVEALPAAAITVECDAIPVAETLTAIDSCGTATVTVVDVKTNGSCLNSYSIARTWTATDACGLTTTHTQIITVQDTKAPTFVGTLPPVAITVECDAVPTAQTLTAIDNCGTATVTVTDVKTNGDCPNNYIITRTWTAIDECGLRTSHTQVITVQDTKAPTVVTPYDAVLNVSCTDIPEVPTLQFTDACSVNVTVVFEETSTFNETAFVDYQIVRTWTVTDECGNSDKFTQTLNVALDEIVSQITAEDRCYDDGIVDLNGYLTVTNLNGTWELIQGDTAATLTGSLFDPTTLSLSADFLPQDGGIDYVFRYTTIENGCISITELTMNINADCVVLPCGENDVEISKALTPNGDGINDTFDIMGIDLCGFQANVKIFNRWGALIYESDSYQVGQYQGGWSGAASKGSIGNATTVPNGTYYYIVVLKDSGLKPFTGPLYIGTK